MRSGQATASAAQASPKPLAEAEPAGEQVDAGTAASDIASECSACVSRYARTGSWNSQNGAARIGSSSAGKCAAPPRTSGLAGLGDRARDRRVDVLVREVERDQVAERGGEADGEADPTIPVSTKRAGTVGDAPERLRARERDVDRHGFPIGKRLISLERGISGPAAERASMAALWGSRTRSSRASPGRVRLREPAVRGAQLLAVSGFALAQPLFDILGKNAEFFAVRGSTPGDIVLFALARHLRAGAGPARGRGRSSSSSRGATLRCCTTCSSASSPRSSACRRSSEAASTGRRC